jgi:hypothetical protein
MQPSVAAAASPGRSHRGGDGGREFHQCVSAIRYRRQPDNRSRGDDSARGRDHRRGRPTNHPVKIVVGDLAELHGAGS